MSTEAVKEMQGLYGPFTLTERVVQKIWLRQDFDCSDLKTTCGKSVQVKDPGRWNLLGGPDFKEARLVLDGQAIVGDVEVHFSPSDWYAHRHECNPEFNSVELHVVLTPDRAGSEVVKTLSGKEPLTLVLMPLLERDLEAYATDDALLEMEKVDELEWIAKFLEQPLDQRITVLRAQADKRWQQKVRFAKQRLEISSWEDCCHQYCLEVLGYSRNRAPMSRLALKYPIAKMAVGAFNAETLFDEEAGNWKLSGLRPANHPRKRLEQYLNALAHNPGWTQQLKYFLQGATTLSPVVRTAGARKLIAGSKTVDDLRSDLFDSEIGSTRFNTMMVDAFLPLATAAELIDASDHWWHWWAGDCPDAVRSFLKHTQLTDASQPICNGLVQGALALFMNRGD
ncbi:MAG: DUF2851 family protein [Opitutaceae bacterium]